MRRFKFLLNKVKFDTNNIDPNRFNELDLAQYFNDAQRHIQTIIVENNVRHEIFSEEFIFDTEDGIETYDLPEDIFATSAINFVDFSSQGSGARRDRFFPARALVNTDRRRGYGYIIRGQHIIITPIPSSSLLDKVRIIYVRKLFEIGPRFGTISTNDAASITVFANLADDQLLLKDYYDKLTVVDDEGNIITSKINILDEAVDTPLPGQHVITTDSDLSDIVPGQHVVGGNVATTHSELPDVCELLLTNLVERTIQYVDSSADAQAAAAVSNEEREAIVSLFKSHPQDPAYPPIVTDEYMNT